MTQVVTSLTQWRGIADRFRAEGSSIGVTMTMGALHAGHVSLFERAAAECDVSLATVFVNPLQFEDDADLARYPADLDADVATASAAGVRAVLAPSATEVWPSWPRPTATSVQVAGLGDVLEGMDRLGHFAGVATVVVKLLIATGPCASYFGEKDFQQLCVVRRAVADLGIDTAVVGCATVRESDGLALSSRNARLSASGRAAAASLWRALDTGRRLIERGESAALAQTAMREVISREADVELAYASVVEPATLRAPSAERPGTEVRLVIAALVEGVRLIDNLGAVIGSQK